MRVRCDCITASRCGLQYSQRAQFESSGDSGDSDGDKPPPSRARTTVPGGSLAPSRDVRGAPSATVSQRTIAVLASAERAAVATLKQVCPLPHLSSHAPVTIASRSPAASFLCSVFCVLLCCCDYRILCALSLRLLAIAIGVSLILSLHIFSLSVSLTPPLHT